MGTYNNLSQGDKDILGAWERNVRGWANDVARVANSARALKASMDVPGGAGDILDGLSNGQVVPNSGGIAGAQDMSKEDWATMRANFLNTFLTNHDTTATRILTAKASGPVAGL